MIVYIDDILLMAESVDHARAHLNTLVHLLDGLGFIINQTKSRLRCKVNSTTLHLSLPGEKIHHIRVEVGQMLQKLQVTAQHLAQIIGKLYATSQAVLPAPVLMILDLQRH